MSRLRTKLQTIIDRHFVHFSAGQLRLIRDYRKAVAKSLGISRGDAYKSYREFANFLEDLSPDERKKKISESFRDEKTRAAIGYWVAETMYQSCPKGYDMLPAVAKNHLGFLKDAQAFFKENQTRN